MRQAGYVGAVSLEVWRTLDGRVLLHQPGRGHAPPWIELLPEMVPWLVKELSYSDGGMLTTPEGPDS